MSDVCVIGGGISGLLFAWHAARSGRQVLVVDGAERPGGCVHTARADGFWLELGAHTCYNSYVATLEVIEALGLLGELQARGKPVLRFLDGDEVCKGKNLGLLVRRMSWWELARSMPRALGAKQQGQSVRSYYGRLVGERNYARALGPMLSAVPSQRADDLPADMLFKKRTRRRKDVLRSFTLKQGLGSLAAALAAAPGVSFAGGRRAARVERNAVVFEDGSREDAPIVCAAAGPRASAALLERVAPEAAATMARVGEVAVDSVGVVVRADRAPLPYATFFIPLDDVFHSIVTRDVVPDPDWRGFAFHFKPGLDEAARLERIAAVLRVPRGDFAHVAHRRSLMPSPALGHRELVARLDGALAGTRLAVCGNWFDGLGIEDCALRARAEWQRVGA